MLSIIPEIFDSASPTPQNVLLMKNWVALMVLIQSVTFVVALFLIMIPYMGLWIGVTCAFGVYAVYGSMNVCILDIWGVLSLCGAIFGMIDLIALLVERSEPLFSASKPVHYNILHALWIVAILVMFASSFLALRLHANRYEMQEECDVQKDQDNPTFGTFVGGPNNRVETR